MANRIQLGDGHPEISGLLQSYIQSGNLNFLVGSGASRPAIETAGDIETQINQLIEQGHAPEADLKALEFIESISKVHSDLITNTASAAITETMGAYKDFVGVIDKVLFERKNLLLPRQANIYTTNYDMFTEHASNLVPTLMLNDGFVRSADIGSEFTFAPERYFDRTYRSGGQYSQRSEVPTINLVKLHGSLSWRRGSTSPLYDTSAVPALAAADRADPAKVAERLKRYFLILPNLRKFNTAMMDRVYYDLLRLFANSMDRENALLISVGFSFADEHILDITKRALRNPTAHLLIFSHQEATAAAFMEKFASQRNATVIAPAAGETATLATLTKLLDQAVPKTS